MQALKVPELLLPRKDVDLKKWAVVACDQFTAQPEYWHNVSTIAGDAPSTLKITYPEVFLNETEAESAKRIQSIQVEMKKYLDQGLLVPHTGFILVERVANNNTRHGIMACIDLEQYEYTPTAQTLVRPTEGTIVERLPPRIRIRSGAPLELPHILILIDDPHRTVIEPLVASKAKLPLLYETDLMLDGGHIKGFAIPNEHEEQVCKAVNGLASKEAQEEKYGPKKSPLVFAVGDGNHSLATAKSVWEEHKKHGANPNTHPARYALVEIENVHDSGLFFEPIHRVVFNVNHDPLAAMQEYFKERFSFTEMKSDAEVVKTIREHGNVAPHKFGFISEKISGVVTVANPPHTLVVGTLQPFLDSFIAKKTDIDYVHGDDVVCKLGKKPTHCGFILPVMNKSDLFVGVVKQGVVPRKTFSMGEANEKRYYLESRKIIQ